MDFKNIEWNLKDYKKYEDYLFSLQDLDYQKFHSKITKTNYKIIGIRVPLMRKIADNIYKGNYLKYLESYDNNYYEEIFIRGIVISKIKDINILIKQMKEFVLKIDNWAICDSFCNSLKIVNKNKDIFWDEILNFIKSDKEFVVRVGIILILNFYIEEKYLDKIFNIFENLNTDKYYINMAISWTICEMYIKYKDKTLKYMKKNKLNSFVQNKTISKIKDSYRISKEEKEYLNQLKY